MLSKTLSNKRRYINKKKTEKKNCTNKKNPYFFTTFATLGGIACLLPLIANISFLAIAAR